PLAVPVAPPERIHEPHPPMAPVVALDVHGVVVGPELLPRLCLRLLRGMVPERLERLRLGLRLGGALPEPVIPAPVPGGQVPVVAEDDRAGAAAQPREEPAPAQAIAGTVVRDLEPELREGDVQVLEVRSSVRIARQAPQLLVR